MLLDPCREWLGIDATDLGDPHRVLGISDSETDATAIRRAAERRLAALRRVVPGTFAVAHASLLARVEESRDALLAAAGAHSPATVPFPGNPRAAPPPPAQPAPAACAAIPAADPAPIIPLGGLPASPGRPTVRRSRSSSGSGLGLVLTLVSLVATGGAVAGFVALQAMRSGGPKQETAVAVRVAVPPPRADREPQADVPTPPAERRVAPPRESRTERPPQPKPAPATPARGVEKPAAPARTSESPPSPPPSPSPPPPGPRETQASAATPPPMADQEAERRLAAERARAAEAVEASLRDAFVALQRQEFDTADRAITAASNRVGDDVEAATRIERWRLLANYARAFQGYRDQAFKAASAGREYQADGRTFSVIEINPELFIYKMAGKIERVPRDQVDPRIALAVVETWFAADGRAANHLFLGARALCLDPPDARRARAEWQIAGQGGEQVAPLVALIDDPVVRRAGGR